MNKEKRSVRREKRGVIALLYIFIFLIMIIVYSYYIFPYWNYQGYGFEYGPAKIAAASVIVMAMALAMPPETNARSFYLQFLMLTHFVPAMVLFAIGGESISSALIFLMAMSIVFVSSTIPIQRLVILRLNGRHLMASILFVSFILILLYIYYGGFRNFNMNIANVYDFRRGAANELPGIFGYLSAIFSKCIATFGLALSLYYRRYVLSLLFIIVSVLIFGFTSHKGVLFYPMTVILAFVFLKRWIRYRYLLFAFIAALLISLIDLSFQSLTDLSFAGWYNSLFFRRIIMVPAFLDYRYIEYFSEHANYFWSSSRIGLGLVASPYQLPPANHMGWVLFGSADSSANTGFVGSGFAQAGLVGVAIYSLGVGLLIATVQAYARRLGTPLVVAATIGPMMNVTATDFPTLFLTHGMFVMFLLLAMARLPQSPYLRHRDGYRLAGQKPKLSEFA